MRANAGLNEDTAVTTTRTAPERLLDPVVLARIANLDLVARKVVDGFISGMHQAINRGTSTDFAEYRIYTPGDDIRRIDWRVFARTDRLYIKTFEAETNADVVVVLDKSASMDFQSRGVNKFRYASMLAASIVHLAARQRDRVGFATFNTALDDRIPCAVKHRDTIIRTLATLECDAESRLEEALKLLAESLPRRSIVMVISDFYSEANAVVRALGELGTRGHDVLAVHLLDPLERELELDQAVLLEDLESGSRLPVSPRGRQDYVELVGAHIQTLNTELGSRQIDYLDVTTDQALDDILFAFLSRRERLKKQRSVA